MAQVLAAIAEASPPLVRLIQRGRLRGGLDSAAGPLPDVFTHKAREVAAEEAFLNNLKGSGVRSVISEKRDDPITIDPKPVEQGGGAATDGSHRIIGVEPTSIHARKPLVFGSEDNDEWFGHYYSDGSAAKVAPLFAKLGLLAR